VKESSPGPSSLLQEFTTQQNENAFLRAFSFSTTQLPADSAEDVVLADRVIMMDEIGFIFQLMEREHKVASKAGDLEKWITNYVVRRGVKQIQNTRNLLKSYIGLSLVNGFGHRVLISPRDPGLLVSVIIYRVPPKTRAFRAARFKKNRNGGFVHILRDVDYFEIVHHFVTLAELTDYFGFRRDILINWDSAATAVSEAALIGQYLLEDYASPPDERFESASRSRGGPTACGVFVRPRQPRHDDRVAGRRLRRHRLVRGTGRAGTSGAIRAASAQAAGSSRPRGGARQSIRAAIQDRVPTHRLRLSCAPRDG